MRYFLYARKSTDSEEKQVLSIESQIQELGEFAAKEKLAIVASFHEAKTAKEPGRTQFAEMLHRIENGEADGILAWHPDRLARNSIDGGKIVYMLDTGSLKDLKFPTFWFDSTPQGKFMLSIAFGQSKYYIDNLSENIKRGHRTKLRKGIWPNWAPLGYLNNHKTREIDVDKEKAPLVAKAFALYATGEYTLKALARFLKDKGLRSYHNRVLTVSCVQRMLQKTIYYGVFTFSGEVYEGKHEPIISKTLFDTVQQVMANRGKKKRKRKHEFLFSGFMHCACGCLITAEKQKGHVYYRCTKKKKLCLCEEKYLREEKLVEQMQAMLQKLSLPDGWEEKMLSELEKEQTKAVEETKIMVQNLEMQKQTIEEKLDRLLDVFLDGHSIEPETYQAKKAKLLNEKQEILEKIKDFERKGNNWLEPMRKVIFASSQAKMLLQKENPNEFPAFLKTIGSNFLLQGKQIDFMPALGYTPFFKNGTFPNWRRGRDSNSRSAFWTLNGLANRCLQPLGHLSKRSKGTRNTSENQSSYFNKVSSATETTFFADVSNRFP